MTSGEWFVLFPKARLPSKDDVLSTLRRTRNAVVTDQGDMEFNVTVGAVSFGVGLNTLPYVFTETQETVEQHRATLDNADEIDTYDARFELVFDQTDIGDLFNPLCAASERLAKLTSGVVYEVNNGVFQET